MSGDRSCSIIGAHLFAGLPHCERLSFALPFHYPPEALYLPALKAHDPNVKGVFEHLITDGKTPLQGVCAVMRKLLHAIHGMLSTSSRSIINGSMRFPHEAEKSKIILDRKRNISRNV